MKLKKPELAAVLVTLALLVLTLGYRFGRSSEPAAFSVSPGETAAPSAETGTQQPPVNINRAEKETLCTLRGIGEVLAERIIAYREENGAFLQIEDITKVRGIGIGIFEQIRDCITVDG